MRLIYANLKKFIFLLCIILSYKLFAEEGHMSKNQSFKVQSFETKYQPEVIELIERIQVGEFSIPIEEGQRKELQAISASFQKNKGNYWVALLDGKVIGTIAVID